MSSTFLPSLGLVFSLMILPLTFLQAKSTSCLADKFETLVKERKLIAQHAEALADDVKKGPDGQNGLCGSTCIINASAALNKALGKELPVNLVKELEELVRSGKKMKLNGVDIDPTNGLTLGEFNALFDYYLRRQKVISGDKIDRTVMGLSSFKKTAKGIHEEQAVTEITRDSLRPLAKAEENRATFVIVNDLHGGGHFMLVKKIEEKEGELTLHISDPNLPNVSLQAKVKDTRAAKMDDATPAQKALELEFQKEGAQNKQEEAIVNVLNSKHFYIRGLTSYRFDIKPPKPLTDLEKSLKGVTNLTQDSRSVTSMKTYLQTFDCREWSGGYARIHVTLMNRVKQITTISSKARDEVNELIESSLAPCK